LITRPEESYWL